MKLPLALALFISLIPFHALAAALTAPDEACKCQAQRHDPLEEPIHFNFGKYRNQCVNSCRFRRARILKNSKAELVVGNILHLGHFVTAKIRPDQVSGVMTGFERFAPGVDHVFLEFTFKSDVPLESQDGEKISSSTTRSIVVSSEGVPPKGSPYSLSDGYFGQYLLDHRVTTGDEFAHWVETHGHSLRMVSLTLSGQAAGNALVHGLLRSDAESFKSTYQLFANNCSTSAISLLDAETHFESKNWNPFHWEEFEAALSIAGPFGTEHALALRGLTKP